MNKIIGYTASVLKKNNSKFFFDREMIEKMVFKHCDINGKTSKISIELPLHENWLNSGGTLHGGAISTLIDQSTTIAIASIDDRNTVSIDLSVSFISALKQGPIEIEAICHKLGKNLAFTSAEIKSNGVIIASGKHTKFMMSSKWDE